MESLFAGGRVGPLPTAATSTCPSCCSTSQVMSRQSGSIFLPTRTGRRITQRNTTASTCLKPPSRARESTVNPSGRNCVRHPRPAMSSLRFFGWRMIQSHHRNNIKTNQSQSAVSAALWLLLLSGSEVSAILPRSRSSRPARWIWWSSSDIRERS